MNQHTSALTSRRTKRRIGITWAAVALTGTMLVLSACGSSSKSTSSSGGTTGTTVEAVPTATIPTAPKDAALAAMVPAKLTQAGKAVVATDASYAPNEFFQPGSTTAIIGMDIDLGHAIGKVLGVPLTFTNAGFDSIIQSIGTRYDVSMSSFTITAERQKQVYMVSYFTAGDVVHGQEGPELRPHHPRRPCAASTVGVEKGTVEQTDATAQSKKCKSDGKTAVTIARLPRSERGQPGADQRPGRRGHGRLAGGRAYAATQSNGKPSRSSATRYGAAPYGIVRPQEHRLQRSRHRHPGALKNLNDSGLYQKILAEVGRAGRRDHRLPDQPARGELMRTRP